jgi:hypothetical protein
LILPQVEGIGEETRQAKVSADQARKRAVNLRLVARLTLGLGILLTLLVIRQLYYGGTIPLLREPEKFKVDVVPPGEHKRH